MVWFDQSLMDSVQDQAKEINPEAEAASEETLLSHSGNSHSASDGTSEARSEELRVNLHLPDYTQDLIGSLGSESALNEVILGMV